MAAAAEPPPRTDVWGNVAAPGGKGLLGQLTAAERSFALKQVRSNSKLSPPKVRAAHHGGPRIEHHQPSGRSIPAVPVVPFPPLRPLRSGSIGGSAPLVACLLSPCAPHVRHATSLRH